LGREFAAGALELLHELTPENAEKAASRQNSLLISLPPGKTTAIRAAADLIRLF
jgi:hypothetical protein